MNLTVDHIDGQRFLVLAGKQAVVVDAPVEEGGTGTGMSAPQLFAASVASCALSFVANSCRLRGLPVEHLRLEMTCEEARHPRRISRMDIRIHVDADVPADQRRALLGVAKHSTVANTLAQPPEIHISVE